MDLVSPLRSIKRQVFLYNAKVIYVEEKLLDTILLCDMSFEGRLVPFVVLAIDH